MIYMPTESHLSQYYPGLARSNFFIQINTPSPKQATEIKRNIPSVDSAAPPDSTLLIMRTTRLKQDEQQRTASFVSSNVNSKKQCKVLGKLRSYSFALLSFSQTRTLRLLIPHSYTGWPQSRRKNSLSFPGFSRAINLLFHRLSQQKVNAIMTFIKGHSTSTPTI